MKKPSIQQIDDFFPQELAEYISKYALFEAGYRYGESDDQGLPTGMVCDLYHVDSSETGSISKEGKAIYNAFVKHIHEKYPGFWDTYRIYRLYINVFCPKEMAFFHEDADPDTDQWTFLYYPMHDFEWKMEQGGWTEFWLDNKIIGVPPFANSLVRFSSEITHRATPFRDHHRMTIAIKVANKDERL